MNATCDATAQRLVAELGFECADAHPIATLRNPADLAGWTLPVLELLIVAGAVFALAHAIRRLRRDGDPTNLALWIASLVYLFVIEPPLYFPGWFGLDEPIGLMFSHNVFTVQFMFDRLPLYIVAFYPAMSQVAYEIVRALGVFARRGPLAGAVCVAFVYQVFYEIFDQLGPQLRWWAWNLDNPLNHPQLASVPLNSVWLFAAVSFGALTYLVVRLIGVPTARGQRLRGWSSTWRTVLAGALAPLVMVVGNVPAAVFGGETPDVTAQTIVITIELIALWTAGIVLLVAQWRANRRGSAADSATADSAFLRIFPAAFLVVHAVLWASALPGLRAAVDGYTAERTPVGNMPYVLACFAAATVSLAAALWTATGRHRGPDEPTTTTPRQARIENPK